VGARKVALRPDSVCASRVLKMSPIVVNVVADASPLPTSLVTSTTLSSAAA
jgi:hypothetical protein